MGEHGRDGKRRRSVSSSRKRSRSALSWAQNLGGKQPKEGKRVASGDGETNLPLAAREGERREREKWDKNFLRRTCRRPRNGVGAAAATPTTLPSLTWTTTDRAIPFVAETAILPMHQRGGERGKWGKTASIGFRRMRIGSQKLLFTHDRIHLFFRQRERKSASECVPFVCTTS